MGTPARFTNFTLLFQGALYVAIHCALPFES